MYTAQVKLRSSKERSYFDQLVDLFIRPPRQTYDLGQLGPATFMINKLLIYREDFTITSRNLQLQCSLYTPVYLKDRPRAVVIYLHGNSSSRLESNCYVNMFAQEGISFLNFDFGGCGISQGEYVSLGWHEKNDLINLISYIREKRQNLTHIGIWGRSMGAVTALIAATCSNEFNALVVDTPFSSLKQLCLDIGEKQYKVPRLGIRFAFYMLRKKVRQLVNYDPKHLDIIKFVKLINQNKAILFLRASDDKFIGKAHIDELYQIFKGEKYLTIFQGDHNTDRPLEVYQQIVRFFINRIQTFENQNQLSKLSLKQKVTHNKKDIIINQPQILKQKDNNTLHTEDQFKDELDQFEIAFEYHNENDQIHRPVGQHQQQEQDSIISAQFAEENVIQNTPRESEYIQEVYLGKLNEGTQKIDKKPLESLDSERYIQVPFEVDKEILLK